MSSWRDKRIGEKRLPVAEILEPRVLYSADALGVMLPLLLPDDQSAERVDSFLVGLPLELTGTNSNNEIGNEEDFVTSRGAYTDALNATADANPIVVGSDLHSIKRVVFVDHAVPEHDKLLNTVDQRTTQLVLINEHDDGLLVITQTLAQHAELDSVQIVSHGSSGQLTLGSVHVNEQTLISNRVAIESWSDALSHDADLHLLGCDVASGEKGVSFVQQLAALTDADVAASDDRTGHTALSADWELEYETGTINSDLALDMQEIQNWTFSLAAISVDTTADGFDIAPGTTLDQLLALQSGGKSVTLREAVHAAGNSAGLDVINLSAGTYVLDRTGIDNTSVGGDLDITDDMTITGAGRDVTTIQMMNSIDRVLEVSSGALSVENLKISGGNTSEQGGAIANHGADRLTVRDSLVTANTASGHGGGLYSAGDLLITGSAVSGNSSAGSGGGAYSSGAASLLDSTLNDNSANDNGGGLFADSITIERSEISGNTSSGGDGGGVYAEQDLTVNNTSLSNNTADGSGGGFFAGSDAIINSGSLISNTAVSFDGGAGYSDASISLNDVVVAVNSAERDGGGLRAIDAITLENTAFWLNDAGDDGGAIHAQGPVSIVDSGFTTNSADDDGGAVLAQSPLSITNSSFVSNKAPDGRGGAIYQNLAGELTIAAVTFSGNQADEAGAIYTTKNGSISSATFVQNQSNKTAGVIWSNGGLITVSNSIFSINQNATPPHWTVVGGAVTGGYNLYHNGNAAPLTTDIGRTDPLLGTLTQSGRVSYYPLLPGSPAINAGSSNGTDVDSLGIQRDEFSDIGAVEMNSDESVIFWADQNGNINRSNIDFSNVQIILRGLTDPTSLSIDKANGKLYWLDQGGSRVSVIDVDGNAASRTVVLSGLSDVSGMSVDAANGFIYVAAAGSNPRIDRYALSGGPVLQSLTAGIGRPVDVVVSADTNRLYWADQGDGVISASIRSSDLDGGNVHVHTLTTNPESIAITPDGTDIYWTNMGSDLIEKLNVVSGAVGVYDTAPNSDPVGFAFDSSSERLIWSSDNTTALSTIDGQLTGVEGTYMHGTPVQDIVSVMTSTISVEPELTTNTILLVDEGVPVGIERHNLLTQDVDTIDDHIVYSVTGGLDHGSLEVAGSAGASVFTQQHINDGLVRYLHAGSEAATDYFSFTVADSVHQSVEHVFQIQVNEINDTPTISSPTSPINIAENARYILQVADLNVIDDDGIPADYTYRLESSVQSGDLLIAGIPVSMGANFTQAQLVAGDVSYQHDGSEVAVGKLTLRVIDDDGAESDVAVDINFNVSPVNDRPNIMIANTTVSENLSGAVIGPVITSDADVGDTVTVTVDDPRFVVQSGMLVLRPGEALDHEQESEINLILTATDTDGLSAFAPVQLLVTDANDAPVVSQILPTADGDGYTVPEGTFSDSDGDTLSVSALQSDGSGLPDWLEFNSTDRSFNVTEPANVVPALELQITASDGRGGSVSTPLVLNFSPPVITVVPPAPVEPVDPPEPVISVPPVVPPAPVEPEEPPAPAAPAAPAVTDAPVEPPAPALPEESVEPLKSTSTDKVENPIVQPQPVVANVAPIVTAPSEPDIPPVVAPLESVDKFQAPQLQTKDVELQSLIAPLPRLAALELAVLENLVSTTTNDRLLGALDVDTDTLELSDFFSVQSADFGSGGDALSDALDSREDELKQQSNLVQSLVGSSAGISTGLSVGYLIWLIRGGTLVGSMLSSLPAWRFVDPLPVLGSLSDSSDDDDESLESMVRTHAEKGRYEQTSTTDKLNQAAEPIDPHSGRNT